jgi:RNA polymerase sigma-70 factor (ECF subfamily)
VTKVIARRHRAEQARYRALARAGIDEVVDGFADRVAAEVSAAGARGALATAMGRLTPADRDVLLLVAWSGLSYEEVAETLGIKVGTVRSRLHRARTQVRRSLGGSNPADIVEEQS